MDRAVAAEDARAGNPAAFTKKQLLAADRYQNRRDLLQALLNENKSYTADQADQLIEKWMKGKVR